MRKKWSIVISLLIFLFLGQQVSSYYSQRSNLLAQYIPSAPNVCLSCGNRYCYKLLEDQNAGDVNSHCVTSNNYSDWCCACFPIQGAPQYSPPEQCRPLWSALGTPTPSPINTTPQPPTLQNPFNGASGISVLPNFTLYSTDYELNNLQYKIYLSDNAQFYNASTVDTNYTGWSKSSYTSGEQAMCTLQSSEKLRLSTQYYWRAYAIDPNGSNTFSNSSPIYSFRTVIPTPTNSPPGVPVLVNPQNEASNVAIFPNFTLYSTDYESNNLRYTLYVCKNGPSCQSSDLALCGGWSKSSYTSGEQAMCTLQSSLNLDSTYYWYASAIDSQGAGSTNSSTYSFKTIPPTPTPASDVGSGGFKTGGTGASYYIASSLSNLTPTPTPVKQLPTPTPPSLLSEIIQTFTPTSTPIPSPTKIPTRIPTQSVVNQNNQTENQSTNPTPTPNIPSSLTSSSTTTETKQVNEINKNTVSKITVKPTNSGTTSTEKTLLPDEQKLINETIQNYGNVTVTLENKSGQQFSTEGTEFIIKRTNQLVSIKTQENTSTQKSSSSKTSSPQLEINSNNVIAHSVLTLSIDPLSGILTVDTPNGPQRVSIMPDEALGIVTELNAIDKNQGSRDILLIADKGKVTYRIEGDKTEKFLGVFPMPIDKIISLSADTGGILKISSSALGSILGLLTF